MRLCMCFLWLFVICLVWMVICFFKFFSFSSFCSRAEVSIRGVVFKLKLCFVMVVGFLILCY